MTQARYILVLDHGTTGLKAVLMDRDGRIVSRGYTQFEQIYPRPGWVEHDAGTLWDISLPTAEAALNQAQAGWSDVVAIGITNQRETVVMWDAETGEPLHNAIVWQCRRTTDRCEILKKQGMETTIHEKTGLVTDPYFSGTKIEWLLENVPAIRETARSGRLRFGTVDAWIIWKLSGGKTHVTDTSNASRTLLFNIHEKRWDPELLELFGVPEEILPEVKNSNVTYGETTPALTGGRAIPIAGDVGDQQAALYGQKCWTPGTAKSTYGTGAFIVMNTGDNAVTSDQGLLTTIACDAPGNPCYALEGAIFIAGGSIEWLIRSMGLVSTAQEANTLATSVETTDGVYLVPAFVGLAAPYWDSDARGMIYGLTQGSGKAHIVRAAYEAMAYQTREVIDAMQQEAGLNLQALRVDGGVTKSRFLVNFLADVLGIPVIRIDDSDLTAKGAGYLAGLAVGFWESPDVIRSLDEPTETFEPQMTDSCRNSLYEGWLEAVSHVLTRPRPAVCSLDRA